jgi:hypothetical protein
MWLDIVLQLSKRRCTFLGISSNFILYTVHEIHITENLKKGNMIKQFFYLPLRKCHAKSSEDHKFVR